MTTKPASVTKRHGHLHINKTYSLVRSYSNKHYRFRDIPCRDTVSEYVLRGYRSAMTFFFCSDSFYYMDGNYNVWKTDIDNMSDVVFNPVCVEKDRTVNFRKLHKLEWLFG